MKVNWMVVWLSFCWWLIETKYFGWNWFPQSDAELFADALVVVLLAVACIQPVTVNIIDQRNPGAGQQ